MKTRLLYAAAVLLVILSLLLACYPYISNYLMSLNQVSEVQNYQDEMQNVDDEAIQQALAEAQAYNRTLFGEVVLEDPFDPIAQNRVDEEYERLLSFSGGVMATVEIPSIDVSLPVYHGTSEAVLQKGVGHLQRTSLPVGGVGTHAVLTGHTGLSTSRLFTDLNQLEEGDIFLIHCLGQTMAYRVDQIKVVLPYEVDDLRIDPAQDYVTLITCTPYGINTHRLLVRGVRTEYSETQSDAVVIGEQNESTWMQEYTRALILGVLIFILLLLAYFVVRHNLKKRRKKPGKYLRQPPRKSGRQEGDRP